MEEEEEEEEVVVVVVEEEEGGGRYVLQQPEAKIGHATRTCTRARTNTRVRARTLFSLPTIDATSALLCVSLCSVSA